MSRMLKTFLGRVVTRGSLEVATASNARFVVGDGSQPRIAIEIRDRKAERYLVLNPELAFGELYMNGRLVVARGTLYELIELLARNVGRSEPPGFAKAMWSVRRLLRRLRQHNTRWRAHRNVAHHYDLDGRLYDLFLDRNRQYSCAYFEREDLGLDEAQQAKLRHIAAKLLVRPGHRVLDIGSGWGGMACYLAEASGARVLGVTLSEEQRAAAVRQCEERALSDRVTFRLQDFRDVPERFDRIVSVGMFEHVGVGYYDEYFRKASALLNDDGVMLLHAIGRMDGPTATNPWIDKYIFPGGYIPALSEVLEAIERSSLIVTDVEILRLHYAMTLRAWRERFETRRQDAATLYDERFCRMWEFYLASCECAFRHTGLMVFQIQLSKSLAAVPLTRGYIANGEAAMAMQEQQRAAERWPHSRRA